MFITLIAACSLSAQTSRKSVALTVYNNDLGVVREKLSLPSQSGIFEIKLTDVPERIDPTSVKLNLDGEVLEQNFRYDLVDVYRILQKYVDKEITLVGPTTIRGALLSAVPTGGETDGGQIVIRNSDGGLTMLTKIDGYQISAPSLPSGLVTKPTLQWQIRGTRSGNQDAELSYMTGGMGWHAEYVATLDEAEKTMSFLSWVSIENESGANYENAELRLIGGDVHRAIRPQAVYRADMAYEEAAQGKRFAPQFQEEQFFEYHEYTLQRPATILNRETKQISLFEAEKVPVTKKYVYTSGQNVDVAIKFANKKDNNLGMPLPAGTVRIFKTKGSSNQFVGEDLIKHTPKDEEITLKVGKVFDIIAEERQTSQERIDEHTGEIGYEIVFRNRKDEDVTIEVERNIGFNAKIISASEKYEMKDAQTARFIIKVPKGGEAKLTYLVRNTW